MNPDPLVVATTTVASREQADALAREILAHRAAACVQIDGPITSHYHWDGEVQQASEWRVTIKTARSAQAALAELVARVHPYDLPQWCVVSADHASPDYARWVQQSVQPQ